MKCYVDTSDRFYATIGLIFVVVTSIVCALKIFRTLRTFVLCQIFKPTLINKGGWAVVTGSTDGIGKAYSKELANRGFNLILISRNQQKLDLTAKELEETYGVKTMTIQADFTGGEEIYPTVRRKLEGLDIDILVNNVGALGKYPCKFLDITPQECVDYINMNILSVVGMSQIVLPRMVEKRSGYVVNVSSVAAVIPLPLKSGYSAAKAFVSWLSQSLRFEYEDKGITIQSLVPSYISTKLVEFSDFLQKPSFFVPDAATYAGSAINTLGVSDVTTGYWTHGLQRFTSEAIPRHLYMFFSRLTQVLLDSRSNKHSD